MWSPCLAETHGAHASLLRFGHTCVVVDSSEVWGTELAVVFGGVSTVPNEGPSPKAIPSAPGEQHAALSDTLVLQAEADTWFSPQTGDTGPSPRAFHCAAVLGRHVYVFGGHILHFDAKTNRKHRTFFNDLWYLDTVSWWDRFTYYLRIMYMLLQQLIPVMALGNRNATRVLGFTVHVVAVQSFKACTWRWARVLYSNYACRTHGNGFKWRHRARSAHPGETWPALRA